MFCLLLSYFYCLLSSYYFPLLYNYYISIPYYHYIVYIAYLLFLLPIINTLSSSSLWLSYHSPCLSSYNFPLPYHYHIISIYLTCPGEISAFPLACRTPPPPPEFLQGASTGRQGVSGLKLESWVSSSSPQKGAISSSQLSRNPSHVASRVFYLDSLSFSLLLFYLWLFLFLFSLFFSWLCVILLCYVSISMVGKRH